MAEIKIEINYVSRGRTNGDQIKVRSSLAGLQKQELIKEYALWLQRMTLQNRNKKGDLVLIVEE